MKNELLDLGSKIIEKIRARGYDEAAVLVRSSRRTMLKIANSQPSVTQHWRRLQVDLYLTKDKRIFILEIRPKDPRVFDKTLDEILKYASVVKESIFYAPLPEPKPIEKLKGLVDNRMFDYIDDPSKLGELAIEAAHRKKIDYVAGTIDLWYREKALVTTNDIELYEDSTGFQMYLRAFAKPDGSGQWSTCSTKMDEKLIEEASLEASRYAVESRDRSSVEPGRYDLVLSPLVFGNLINVVARMTSAFSIFMGMSIFMRYKPGDRVASEKLTIRDAPRYIELPYATSFDDEGVPTRDKPLIENGLLKNILHNSKTASKLGVESTGNAGWIYPHAWNIIVNSGDANLEELIGSVKRGILITNNWYTRLQNAVEGLFSTITRDALFLIENGSIKQPVEKIRIADTFPNLLNNIEELGRKTYNIMWWEVSTPTKLPYVLVRNINVSKHML